MKKRIKDAIDMMDEICYEMEETYECGTHSPSLPGEMVMEMSPQDHILMFERMQDYIGKMRDEIEFLLVKMGDDDFVEDYNDNESSLCDRCNKRLSRKERNR